jgi:hypothetical protein
MDHRLTAPHWHPPSGFDAVDGYIWLPRMLAKARRARVDVLNEYFLFEASPLDSFALGRWGITGAQVASWLDAGLDDAAIAGLIAAKRGDDAFARERWSRSFRFMYGFFLAAIDADEGRMAPGPLSMVLRAQLEVVFRVVKLRNKVLGR